MVGFVIRVGRGALCNWGAGRCTSVPPTGLSPLLGSSSHTLMVAAPAAAAARFLACLATLRADAVRRADTFRAIGSSWQCECDRVFEFCASILYASAKVMLPKMFAPYVRYFTLGMPAGQSKTLHEYVFDIFAAAHVAKRKCITSPSATT